MKYFILVILLTLGSLSGMAQKETDSRTLSPDESKQLLSQLKIDSTKMLAEVATEACTCIDSIRLSKKNHKEISADIASCIDKHVGAYQLSMLLMKSLTGGSSDKIELSIDKNSVQYKKFYYEIERWLKDSCSSMNLAVVSNNEESALSMSANPLALSAYNMGIEFLKQNEPENAIKQFEQAVKIDPRFVFAWDNLGVCRRKAGKLDEALDAYNKSLELDPKGVTPLHNIPVVYEYQKKYDEALAAYGRITSIYPDDPEAFYGKGRIYSMYKIDYEKALDNMCKAYNAYVLLQSPYRVDAEKNIQYIYSKMKAEGKESRFMEILKANKINAGN